MFPLNIKDFRMKEFLGYASQAIANLLPKLNNTPILITGTPRSGTTFVGEILSHSKQLKYVYEPMNPDYGYPIKNYKCIICGCKVDKWYRYITKENDLGYYKHFKHLINSKALQGKTALLKAPFSAFAAEWLNEEFGARPIVMFRNPLSFVSSIKRMNWPVDFKDFLEQEELMTEHLSEYKDEMIKVQNNPEDIIGNGILQYNVFYSYIQKLQKAHPEWLYVKLEDLSENPVPNFKKIFEHFDLDFSKDVENKIVEFTSEKNPTEVKTSTVHALKRNSKELMNVWKQRLTDEEVTRILKETQKVTEPIYPGLR